MKIRSAPGRTYPLQFRSYSDAVMFYDWLTDDAISGTGRGDEITIGRDTLIFESRPLTANQVARGYGFKVMPVAPAPYKLAE